MKKWLALVLAFMLVITTATACSDEGGDKTIISDDFLKQDLQPATVTFSFPDYPNTKDYQLIFDELSSRALSAFNIDLRFIESNSPTKGDYNRTMNPFASIEGKNLFDAAITYVDIYELVQKDYIMDITDLLPQNAPDLYARYSKDELMQVSVDNKIYAIPPKTSGSQRMCAVVREDIAKEYANKGIDTLEDYEALIDSLNKNEAKQDFTSRICETEAYLFPQLDGYGMVDGYMVYKLDDPQMKLVPWEETENYRKYYKFIQRMMSKNVIYSLYRPDPSKVGQDNLATFLTSWDEAYNFVRATPGSGLSFKVYPLYTDKMAMRTNSSHISIVVNKNSRHPDLVIKLVEWIHMNQDIYDLLMYGIEDTHYSLEGTRVKLNPENASYYTWRGAKAFVDEDLDRGLATDPIGYKDSNDYEIHERCVFPPTVGYRPNYNKVSIERVRRRNRIVPHYVTAYYNEETGSGLYKDFSDIFEVIEWVESYHFVDDLVYETQVQLDVWRRSSRNVEELKNE